MYEDYKEILIEKRDKILLITFNNPKKKNAINRRGYLEITRILKNVNDDDSVTMVVFTGQGDFYTAGNNLSPSDITDMDAYIVEANIILKNMVYAFIECTKIIVALVNGPCIGIGATLAALADLVWCSETAYFSTPFVKLGIVPEAGSSYLLPLLVGRSKGTEILLFGEKLTPQDALQYRFVSRIYKHSELQSIIWPKLFDYSNLPRESLKISKGLLRSHEKPHLIKAIDCECLELHKRFHSEEFMTALLQFTTRKSKL